MQNMLDKVTSNLEKITVASSESVGGRHRRYCESFEKSHSDRSVSAHALATLPHLFPEPVLRMDSQCKYGCVARGDSILFMRRVATPGYREKIWDHAAGTLLVREAGGFVCNGSGSDLSFNGSSFLPNYDGLIMAGIPTVKDTVLATLKQ